MYSVSMLAPFAILYLKNNANYIYLIGWLAGSNIIFLHKETEMSADLLPYTSI